MLIKKIKIWWLGLLIDYHQAMMNETGFDKLDLTRRYDMHRRKRDSLENRLREVFYG